MNAVSTISLPTPDGPLSALLAEPAVHAPHGQAQGLIVALHGGSYRAGYWHADTLPEASLLLLGAQLGYVVLAPDRPGYGAAAGWPRERQGLAHQAETMFDVIAAFRAQRPALAGRPVFLIGHSMGGILALMMADTPRASLLAGVDVSGVPLRYPPEMQKVLDEQAAGVGDSAFLPERSPDEMRSFFYGPAGSYLPAAVAHDKAIHAPVPVAEFIDAASCPARLPARMQNIRIPVQLTIPEFEKSSLGGEESLAYARSFLTRSRRVVTWLQPGAGHNISLHKVARAYHLRALAFFEECRPGMALESF